MNLEKCLFCIENKSGSSGYPTMSQSSFLPPTTLSHKARPGGMGG